MDFLNSIRRANLQDIRNYYTIHKDEINKPNERGATPLSAALASARIEVVELILQLGADPNYTSEKTTLPLIRAIDYAMEEEDYNPDVDETRIDTIETLLKYNADASKIDVQEGVNAYEYSKRRHPAAEAILERAIKNKR